MKSNKVQPNFASRKEIGSGVSKNQVPIYGASRVAKSWSGTLASNDQNPSRSRMEERAESILNLSHLVLNEQLGGRTRGWNGLHPLCCTILVFFQKVMHKSIYMVKNA